MSSSIDSTRPNLNQPTIVDEVSLDDGWLNASIQRMLITLGLAILGKISNEFNYWTNFIANIAGQALGIWICGCSLCYIKESSGPQNQRVQNVMSKDLRVRAPPLSYSLYSTTFLGKFYSSQPLVGRGHSCQIALGEIAGGVSARETLKDVLEKICRIFQDDTLQ
jgi:hypothetical protein